MGGAASSLAAWFDPRLADVYIPLPHKISGYYSFPLPHLHMCVSALHTLAAVDASRPANKRQVAASWSRTARDNRTGQRITVQVIDSRVECSEILYELQRLITSAVPLPPDISRTILHRAATCCHVNQRLLRAMHGRFRVRMDVTRLSSLEPALGLKQRQAIVRLFAKVNKSRSGAVNLLELDEWICHGCESVGDSVYLRMLFSLVPTARREHFSVGEFMHFIDRIGIMTESELIRFAFYGLASIGREMGGMPLIVASHLTSGHYELQHAAVDPNDINRPLLQELLRIADMKRKLLERTGSSDGKRISLKLNRMPSLEVPGTANCSAGSDDEDDEDDDQEEPMADAPLSSPETTTPVNSPVNDPSVAAQPPSPATLHEEFAPWDLIQFSEFKALDTASPLCNFAIRYIRKFIRRTVFGEAYWKRRRVTVKAARKTERAAAEAAVLSAAAAVVEQQDMFGDEPDEYSEPLGVAVPSKSQPRMRTDVLGTAESMVRLPRPDSKPANVVSRKGIPKVLNEDGEEKKGDLAPVQVPVPFPSPLRSVVMDYIASDLTETVPPARSEQDRPRRPRPQLPPLITRSIRTVESDG